MKDRKEDYLKWGDEIEYMIVTMNSQERTVCICLTAAEHLPKLQKDEIEDPEVFCQFFFLFLPTPQTVTLSVFRYF